MKYRYNRISERFWTDEKVLNWDNNTKFLALYLLTCPHRNTEGLFRLPKQYIIADLNWDKQELDKAFNQLLEDGFIEYDEKVKVIYIPRAIKYQSPDNPNQEKSAIRKLKEIPKSELMDKFITETRKHNKGFGERLVKQFGKPRTRTQALSRTQSLKNSSSGFGKNEVVEKDFPEDSKAYKAASYLREKILENNLRASVPTTDPEDKRMKSWAKEMDRLHRLGPIGAKEEDNKGYSWKEIYQLIDWSQNNNFWKSNILSAAKLRKQIIKLENRMKHTQEKNSDELSMLQELYDDYEEEDLEEANKVL